MSKVMDLRNSEGRRELGRRIQSAIVEAGYESLPAFAKELGCSRALIYQYVNGHVLVQPDRLQSIAELTGKSLEWFFATKPGSASAVEAELRKQLQESRSKVHDLEGELARERGARTRQREKHRRGLMDAMRQLCLAHRRAGEPASMLEVAPRWLELARDAEDEAEAMAASLQMGHAWFQAGDMKRAENALRDALSMALAAGDTRAEDSVRQELVRVLQALGRTDDAREHGQRVAEAERWWPRWSGLVSLAALAEQMGDFDAADAHLDEAAKVIDEGEESPQYGALARTYVASNRVNVSLARGRYAEALELAEAHRALAATANLPDQLREAALNVGIAHVRLGNVAQAAEHLERLGEWAIMSGDRRVGALAQVFASELMRRCGDLLEAKRAALAAVESAMGAGHELVVGEAQLALGEVYAAEGQWDDAEHQLGKCVALAERLDLRRLAVVGRLGLARVAARQRRADAAAAVREVEELASEIGYEDLHADALLVQASIRPPERARELAEEAIRLAHSGGYFWAQSGGLLAHAWALLALERLSDAATWLRQAVRLKRRCGEAAPGSTLLASERALRAAVAAAFRKAGKNERAAQLERLKL